MQILTEPAAYMAEPVNHTLRWAGAADADVVARLVQQLLAEISQRIGTPGLHFENQALVQTARRWLVQGQYLALLAYDQDQPVGVATVTQSFALYAGGAIGIIQEFYVQEHARSGGLGAQMLDRVIELARRRNWCALELCTPPVPEFDRALSFYRRYEFAPVGGRKMRRVL